jgi:hypothetical protein
MLANHVYIVLRSSETEQDMNTEQTSYVYISSLLSKNMNPYGERERERERSMMRKE